MMNPLKGQSALYKSTAISGIGMLLGIGLCGAGTWIPEEGVTDIFFRMGSIIFWLSALGMALNLVWWIVAALIESARPRR